MRCVTLKRFIGGLGNQCFQVASIVAYCRRTGMTYRFPTQQAVSPGFVNSPCYTGNVFKHIAGAGDATGTDVGPTVAISAGQWFAVDELDGGGIHDNNIEIDSMLMNVANFEGHLAELRELFLAGYAHTPVVDPRRICLAVRRFTEEGHTEWASTAEYYRRALDHLRVSGGSGSDGGSLDGRVICVFGDERSWAEEFLTAYLLEHGLSGTVDVEWYIGKRDGQTDVDHFYRMFECATFVLCNSSYHYWPAVLSSVGGGASVIHDSSIDWQKNIIPRAAGWTGI